MKNLFKKNDKTSESSLPLFMGKHETSSPHDLSMHTRSSYTNLNEPEGIWHRVTRSFREQRRTSREIRFSGHVSPRNNVGNVVKNQKYNILTFVPLVLYNEFKLFFNLFFLLSAITQFIPHLQTGYLISYIGPLGLVLFLTMAKEFYDDYLRYKRDKEANSTTYIKVIPSGISKIVSSADLKVGDIIEVHSNQRIPADLVLLYASEPNGSVFIRTDQLDGETDWKLRKSIRYTQKHMATYGSLAGLENTARIAASPPMEDIYNFEGVFSAESITEGTVKESLTLENTLWANTVLASSGKIYGMIVYTGVETRTVLNARDPRTKIAKVDLEINRISKVLFVFLMSLSLVMVGLRGFGADWYIQLVRFIILLSTIIPISIRVNMDFSKLVFSARINADKKMPGTSARNRSIPEDLGRIQFLLTDKTGTLTKNEMVLRKIALENGMVYSMTKKHEHRKTLRKAFVHEETESNEKKEEKEYVSADDNTPELPSASILRKSKKRVKEYKAAKNFWRAVALCHNVTPVEEDGNKWYQASSPDEIALVEGASHLSMRLVSRDQESITIESSIGKKEEYAILANFPFSSETKRMGIILKNINTGKIIFYLKGADIVMCEKVSHKHYTVVQDTCEALAQEGLRTLVITQKYLSEEDYNSWKEKYDVATHALTKRNKKVQEVIDSLEYEMDLLGITGVEDMLQDEVCNTLENMKHAGIKIWMLTGDKVETAITVAISAGLKTIRDELVIMKEIIDPEEVKSKLLELGTMTNAVLVIDGKTLEVALQNCEKEFFQCTTGNAPAVVCCRCSPTQKATITEGIKKMTGQRTCAIGDGGNDVGMIQAADVGIGIEGKEGKQAALAADYSIAKFEYLNRLILWHGRNSYKGSSVLIHFVIHRGLIISFLQALFSILFYDLSISIYTGILNLGYTTIFTWLPVLSLIFDEDVDEEIAMQFPTLYKSLQKGRELSLKNFFVWLWWSLYQASVIMLCTLYMFDNSYYNIITITFTALIAAELFNVFTTLNKIHWIAIISVCFSLVSYILVIVLLKKHINASTITLKFLYNIIFLTIVSWLPMQIIKMLKARFAPSEQQRIMAGFAKRSMQSDTTLFP